MIIKKPTVIVDKKTTLEKIERMANKAKSSSVRFRPHFKTHQSAEIGDWFKQFGVSSITVSSVEMGIYFANHGWNDIMVCIPANINQIDQINSLAKNNNLHLITDSSDTVAVLGKKIENKVKMWIEIDTGNRRTGFSSKNTKEIVNNAKAIQNFPNLSLTGIVTHAGHSYEAKSINEIKKVYSDSVSQMKKVKESLISAGFSNIEISIGDTPSCTVIEKFERPVDEIRPGNFVFNDLMQVNLGVCPENEVSMTVACPVISKHPERNEIIIYGGFTSLAKEFYTSKEGKTVYGLIALPDEKKGRTAPIEDAFVSNLTQEHGKIKTKPDFIKNIKIGDILHVLPIHSCFTALLHKQYFTFEGEILTTFKPDHSGKSQ